jgi:2-oxoglutarate dehydrogenase E2 component (dihydrolipoamide succinyltransferase)
VKIGATIGSIGESAAAPAAAAAPAPAAPAGKKETKAAAAPAPVVEAKPAAVAPAPVAAPAPKIDLSVAPAKPAAAAPAVRDQSGRTTRQRMSPLRKKIATHLVNAQQTAAILTTFNEVDMTEVMNLRKLLQDGFVARHGVKLGFMSFFIKAVVEALKTVPAVNGRIDGDDVITNHFYDIGVAIGTERGLIVPVIRDADQKSFADLEKEIIAYANRGKEGKISMEDLQGGCFTISNGGVYGSLLSTPILNPPQSAILGMHTIQQRPVALNGKVEIRPMMYLALSYDHRIVDGKEAVTFLKRVKEVVENPSRLLLEA